MKDIFQEFKQATLRKHLAVGVSAFAFALGINVFLFNTDVGVKMQASAIEAVGNKSDVATADVSVFQGQPGTGRAHLRLERGIQKVKEIEMTVLANPDAIAFGTVDQGEGVASKDIIVTSNVPGVSLVKVMFGEPTDIAAGSSIATLNFTNKSDASVIINLAAPRATTADGIYELTSKGAEVR